MNERLDEYNSVAVELLFHRQRRVVVLHVEDVERRLKTRLDPSNGPFSGTTRVGRSGPH